MLLVLLPIIKDGKIDDAAAVLQCFDWGWSMMEDMLLHACKKLRLGNGFVENAKNIEAENHLENNICRRSETLQFRTRFWRTATLVNALTEAKMNFELAYFMQQFEKIDLLICDEWGYVPIDADGAKLLFQVVSECYERKSIIITTNLEFARWNDIFADSKITAALLDRIIHHSHLLDFTSRDSMRLQDAMMNREVKSTS